jgi:DAK2 domain fusion protein YloV
VDAGGQGYVYILEGMQSVVKDGKIVKNGVKAAEKKSPKLSTANVGKGVFAQELNPDITNAYCTEFLVNKDERANAPKLRAFLESNGDSVVLVDDDESIKCHVHAADPGKILSQALMHGYLTKIKIENMHEQYVARQAQGAGLQKQANAEKEPPTGYPYAAVDNDRGYGFVAVAAGDGLANIFKDLGVDAVVSGGQTMNPSTEDILAAAQSVPAKTVFVLPNNKNIIMAAEQAAKLADRKLVVLPTRTVPQGMSAMLAFDLGADAQKNATEMGKMAGNVDTGLITFAARNSDFDGHKINKGEILALENGKLANVGNDITKMTYRLARSMSRKGTSFITLIYGSDVTEEQALHTCEMVKAKVPAGIEVTLLNGGQPVYYYMISVE